MKNCLITLKSETYSQRAGRLLRENGIPSYVIRLGGEYSSKGCGHGLRIDCRSRAEALKIMKENGIPFSDVREL